MLREEGGHQHPQHPHPSSSSSSWSLLPPAASQQGRPGRAQGRVITAESALSDWTEPDARPVELLGGADPAGSEAGTSWMVHIKRLGLDSGGPGGELYNLFSETIQKM